MPEVWWRLFETIRLGTLCDKPKSSPKLKGLSKDGDREALGMRFRRQTSDRSPADALLKFSSTKLTINRN